MGSTTVRIDDSMRDVLRQLAAERGISMREVLALAVEAYRRKVFFERLNADYAALRADPQAWAEELAERELWDSTLMDGLEDDR